MNSWQLYRGFMVGRLVVASWAVNLWVVMFCIGICLSFHKLFGEWVDWREALVVPVPKKGNLRICDNWRGISLLDVAGKVFGQIGWVESQSQCYQSHNVVIAQCWYGFVASQFVREHACQLFILCVDLRKAFDCVPAGQFGMYWRSLVFLWCYCQ